MSTQALFYWLRHLLPLAAAISVVACVPRALETPAPAEEQGLFAAFAHQGVIRVGVHTHLLGPVPVATDSFRVFHSARGGYVLHTLRRGLESRSEMWLEVGADYRPLRGWERVVAGAASCEWAFVLGPNGIDTWTRAPHAERGTRLQFAAPPRFAVRGSSAISLGWGVAAALGTGNLWILEFAGCPDPATGSSGLVEVAVERSGEGRWQAAGREFEGVRATLRGPRATEEFRLSREGMVTLRHRDGQVDSDLVWYWSLTGR